jgi:hypothetical protein
VTLADLNASLAVYADELAAATTPPSVPDVTHVGEDAIDESVGDVVASSDIESAVLQLLSSTFEDTGAKQWAGLTPDAVRKALCLNKDGVLPITRRVDDKPAITPTWHQLVGGACFLDRSFPRRGTQGTPVMLADQVGMGKTLQVVVFLQLLMHIAELQKTNLALPEGQKGRWPSFLGESIRPPVDTHADVTACRLVVPGTTFPPRARLPPNRRPHCVHGA